MCLTREELKSWICNNCYSNPIKMTGKRKLKGCFSDFSYWKKHNFVNVYEDIICVTEFLPSNSNIIERFWCILNDVITRPSCLACNTPLKFNMVNYSFGKFCSKKCTSFVTKKSRLEVPSKNLLNDLYVTLTIGEIATKFSVDRRTVDRWFRLYEIKKRDYRENYYKEESVQRRNDTTLERFGTLEINSLHSKRKILSQKNKERFKYIDYSKLNSKDWLEDEIVNKGKRYVDIAKELGVNDSTIGSYVRFFNIDYRRIRYSIEQKEVSQFISLFCDDVIINDRKILKGKELDIFLPSRFLAIEYNGIYWHGEYRKPKKYHLDKTQHCANKGIRLIHIFSNEWNFKQAIVKERLLNILGHSEKIFARKCTIQRLSSNDARIFHDAHHLHGGLGAKTNYCLLYNDKLVAVMSFGKARFNKKYQWELLRYSSVGTIVGGAGKLFAHFIRTQNPQNVISYCDLRWGTGGVYEKIGFKYVRQSPPNYFYSQDGLTLESRNKYQKHKLRKILPAFDESKSEWENMKENGYDRIWDCGNKVYVWER